MKKIICFVFPLLLIPNTLLSQINEDKLIGKWYICSETVEFDSMDVVFLHKTMDCIDAHYPEFYWEFNENGVFYYSDTLVSSNDIINGLRVGSNKKDVWKLDLDELTVIIYDRKFKIDVLEKNNIILHRLKE